MQHFAESYLIPTQLLLAMLGMGATLTPADFAAVARERRSFLLGLALHYMYVPLLAVGFIHAFGLSKGWAVGLCIFAAVPSGALTTLLTFIGKGNVALSIALTAVTSLAALVVVPLFLSVLASSYVPADFRMPAGDIVFRILVFLLLPVAVGMSILRFRPELARPLSTWTVRAALVLLVILVTSTLGTGRIKLGEYGWGPPLMLTLLGIVLSVLTPVLCRLLGASDEDNVTLSIQVSVRNMGLGLLLFDFFFRGEPEQRQVLYTCLFFAGMGFFIGFPIALRHRAGKPLVIGMAPKPRQVESIG